MQHRPHIGAGLRWRQGSQYIFGSHCACASKSTGNLTRAEDIGHTTKPLTHHYNPHHQHHRPGQYRGPPSLRRVSQLHKPIGNHPGLGHRCQHHQPPPARSAGHDGAHTQQHQRDPVRQQPHSTYTNGNSTTHTKSTICQYNTPDSSPDWRPGP